MQIRRIIVPALTFVLGIVLGVVVMHARSQGFHEYVNEMFALYRRDAADSNRQHVARLVVYESLLYEHRDDDLRQLIQDELLSRLNKEKRPGYTLGLLGEGYSPQRFIRGYFDLTKEPIPASIDKDIQSVPKGSGMDVLQFADAMVRHERIVHEAAVPP